MAHNGVHRANTIIYHVMGKLFQIDAIYGDLMYLITMVMLRAHIVPVSHVGVKMSLSFLIGTL